MEGCGLAVAVGVACCCGAEICAAEASAGAAIGLWLAGGARVSSVSRDSRDSRFLGVVCGMVACGLAVVGVACCCGAGICAAVASAGFKLAVTACCGMTMASCDVAGDMRFSRFPVGVCAMEDNSLSGVAMAFCIIDENKTSCPDKTEIFSGDRQNGIASADKLCKSMPGMSISK